MRGKLPNSLTFWRVDVNDEKILHKISVQVSKEMKSVGVLVFNKISKTKYPKQILISLVSFGNFSI